MAANLTIRNASSNDKESIERTVHHVFLPPELPHTDDLDSEVHLPEVTLRATKLLKQKHPLQLPASVLDNIIYTLESIRAINHDRDGNIDEVELRTRLTALPVGQMLAFKVTAQNAAVLVTRLPGKRQASEKLLFECFELAARNESIMSIKGRLIRTFPSKGVSIDIARLDDVDFLHMICNTLAKMSRQEVAEAQPKSKKTGVQHAEHRDTTDPLVVSGLFFGMLSALGAESSSTAITKHIREEVLWRDTLLPWRRSPMWLLLRVALQLVIERTVGSRAVYKQIMLWIHCQILDQAQQYNIPLQTSDQAQQCNFSMDFIYVMEAKIVRMHRKLGGSTATPKFLDEAVHSSLSESHRRLQQRWQQIQREDKDRSALDLSTLRSLNFRNDTNIRIPELDNHLIAMAQRGHSPSEQNFHPKSNLLTTSAHQWPSLIFSGGVSHEEAIASLHELEAWVVHEFRYSATQASDIPGSAYMLLKQYHESAKQYYEGNPEATSVMLLTIFCLFVICDRAAVKICPLLGEYTMDIPLGVLETLLLHRKAQMQQLLDVEEYAKSRLAQYSCMFDIESPNSFAVRFYDSSDDHKALHHKITARGQADHDRKLEELDEKRTRYCRLESEAAQLEHEWYTVIPDEWSPLEEERRHWPSCKKCSLVKQYCAIQISVHEWPISKHDTQAKSIVFELAVPNFFAQWRDCRNYLLMDVLQGSYPRSDRLRAEYRLESNDPHLTRDYYRALATYRLGLVSEDKPTKNTHYSSKSISSLSATQICVANGLRYRFYNKRASSWVTELTFGLQMQKSCTFRTSKGTLDAHLFRPASRPDGMAPNEVIAQQHTAPEEMSIEEYRDLASVPLGHRTQWLNINLQLYSPTVNFKRPDTVLVFMQCLYQTGPSNGQLHRSSHSILRSNSSSIATSIVKSVEIAIRRLRGNWESATAFSLFVAVVTRVLDLNDTTRHDCLAVLAEIREISSQWISTLSQKADEAVTDEDRLIFITRSVEASLIGAATLDVGDLYLERLLAEPSNVALLVRASINIHEGTRSGLRDDSLCGLMRTRHTRLMQRCSAAIAKSTNGLDEAVKLVWSSYERGSLTWEQASGTKGHWLTTQTSSGGSGTQVRQVHINVLDGQLLVDGLPLDQPPAAYKHASLYPILFGQQMLKVMPSTAVGFKFSTKKTFGAGYSVQLGLDPSTGSLLVQARRGHEVWEVVSKNLLERSYPSDFVENYVHFYNLTTGEIQLRPRDDPWNAEASGIWWLSRHEPDTWHMHQNGNTLIGLNMPTSIIIGDILHAITQQRDTHIVRCCSKVQIAIPSLRLRFCLNQGDSLLESMDHASMHIDADQSIGCLTGLMNKLVLRNSDGTKRLLLIPASTVTHQRASDHVKVTLAQAVEMHAYKIEPLYNRLIDTGMLSSKLYLAYLHALTSACLPDELTVRTGTESSLAMLDSAVMLSSQQLTSQDLKLLQSLTAISPRRVFYPQHKQSMQNVSWARDLPMLSQHSWFDVRVECIMKHYRRQHEIFNPDETPPSSMRPRQQNQHLVQRDDIRSAMFRLSTFGAEASMSACDVAYTSRCEAHASRVHDVAILSNMIDTRSSATFFSGADNSHLWSQLVATGRAAAGPSAIVSQLNVSYDASLLEEKSGREYALLNMLPLRQLCIGSATRHKYSTLMFLASLSFAKDKDLALLQIMAMSMHLDVLQTVHSPEVANFDASLGYSVAETVLTAAIDKHTRSFEGSLESRMARLPKEKDKALGSRRHNVWEQAKRAAIKAFVRGLIEQWPTAQPTTPAPASQSYINETNAMATATRIFKQRHDNLKVRQHLDAIEAIIARLPGRIAQVPLLNLMAAPASASMALLITRETLLSKIPVPSATKCSSLTELTKCKEPTQTSTMAQSLRLDQMLDTLERQSSTEYDQKYAKDLRQSSLALLVTDQSHAARSTPSHAVLLDHLTACQQHMDKCYEQLVLSTEGGSQDLAHKVHLAPRISSSFFLEQLNRDNWSSLSLQWQQSIVQYGLAITAFQQAKRLVGLSDRGQSLTAELSNTGHTWDPMSHPEDLLIEIEGDFMIRALQTRVAQQMKTPSGNKNSTVQLNMGEGKTSVLVPIIATFIANCDQIPVVVVGKPQSQQMADMLRARLGGLINRRIYFMPFSRSLQLGDSSVQAVLAMIQECRAEGGVLLLQPEHILSFQLMSAENHLRSMDKVGWRLSEVQDYLDQWSRYLIDECDENLSVRFELVYAIGDQNTVDGGSTRWTILQEVLGLVRLLSRTIASQAPDSIEVREGPKGSFPRTRILRQAATDMLLKLLARHICDRGISALPVDRQQQAMRDNVYVYLTEHHISVEAIAKVEESPFWTDSTKKPLMLLRGLIAGGLLEFVFRAKRWRVQYGPTDRSPTTRLAVPYSAKDCPSLRSEFSHPDIVILLTCLSLCYEGLSNEDLFNAFAHLSGSDEPDNEYALWVKDANDLPDEFQSMPGINTMDREQCIRRVFPALRYSKGAIDYFLNKLVFPKEMKEFPSKLSASGWDIGKVKRCVTTGFSGTNDSRHLLPLMVHHFDLPESSHTNALVLEYLLQPINTVQLMTSTVHVDNDAESLLETVTSLTPPVEVILDVGAQVIEQTNRDFAANWLSRADSSKEAVVFVDQNDVISVLDRLSHNEPLQSSPFSSRLSACLIFLDESHTRGIDLKLPVNYRAAVTLGAQLTKDRLVQACMRMRQLGKGQSVVFCVRDEIKRKIQEVTGHEAIDVQSVLMWSMSETRAELRRFMPLWAAQGVSYFNRAKLWEDCKTTGKTELSKGKAQEFLEAEAQTVEQRYRPNSQQDHMLDGLSTSTDTNVQMIASRCREYDNLDFDCSTLQEEQERELAAEVQQEREVQRPASATALKHHLHPLVTAFATTGTFDRTLPSFKDAFVGAFPSLQQTSAAANFPTSKLSSDRRLFVTQDFAKTVELWKGKSSDSYQRSVQWILTNCKAGSNEVQYAVVISPYEANLLIGRVKKSKVTSLHQFKARCNYNLPSLDDLTFCTISGRQQQAIIPRRLKVQLAIFGGSLYITSYADYKEICSFLGLSCDPSSEVVDADGFIERDSQGRVGGASGLSKSPVSFLHFLMSTVRRNGEAISRTHMGRLLSGQLLHESDFEAGDASNGIV